MGDAPVNHVLTFSHAILIVHSRSFHFVPQSPRSFSNHACCHILPPSCQLRLYSASHSAIATVCASQQSWFHGCLSAISLRNADCRRYAALYCRCESSPRTHCDNRRATSCSGTTNCPQLLLMLFSAPVLLLLSTFLWSYSYWYFHIALPRSPLHTALLPWYSRRVKPLSTVSTECLDHDCLLLPSCASTCWSSFHVAS